MSRQFQSIQGPTDPSLRHSEIEGYQPVSRIGEIVINSFGAPLLLNTHSYTHTHTHTPLTTMAPKRTLAFPLRS
tara:strand:- start:915 stop:1136 length:222 start_codon:yes stop_codon:yes gene_type:complete